MQVEQRTNNTVVQHHYSVPWMLLWANLVHVGWAVLLIAYPDSRVSRIVGLVGLDPFVDIGISLSLVGMMITIAAVVSSFGLIVERRNPNDIGKIILCLAPQYLILNVAIISDLIVYAHGSYMGDEIARTTIFGILWPLFVGAICHSGLILERYILPWIRKYVREHMREHVVG